MKLFLFPRVFRIIGWIVFVPSLVLSIPLLMYGTLNLSGLTETIANDTAIIGIALGSLFITCSRERIEDEMTGAIRLRSLLSALYAYVAFLVMETLVVNGMYYFYVMAANLVAFPIIFTLRFRYEMHKYYTVSDEEQN